MSMSMKNKTQFLANKTLLVTSHVKNNAMHLKKQWKYKSNTQGYPKPILAQLTPSKAFFKASVTGEMAFGCGNMQILQMGQVYPDGDVCGGNLLAYSLRQSQWKTSTEERKIS